MGQKSDAPGNTHQQTKTNEVEYTPLVEKPNADDNVPGSPGFGRNEVTESEADNKPTLNEELNEQRNSARGVGRMLRSFGQRLMQLVHRFEPN